MIIYPAIDLLGGRCVRLYQGAFDRATHYDADPLAAARRWRDQGAAWLHIVDLDGARLGHPVHLGIVADIANATSLPLRLGGGLRTADDVANAFAAGVRRVALGTAALDDDLLRRLVQSYTAPGRDEGESEPLPRRQGEPAPSLRRPERNAMQVIEVALDQRGNEVAVEGWQRMAGTAAAWARRARVAGVSAFLVTDITRDGTLGGANAALVGATRAAAGDPAAEVTIAGGVTTVADIRALARAGASGAVIGRALYDGRIALPEALAAAQEAAC